MNVRTKLIIGFSIIVVLLWMIAFFVGMGYRNLQQQFMSVGDEIITETLFVTNVESLATETYRYTLDYMLHGSEEARLNTLSILDRLEVIEEMNPPVNITTGEAESVDKQQFIVAVSQFHFAVSNIIKVKENGASIEDLLVMDQIVGLPALLSLQQSASILKADNNTALAVVKTDFNRTYYAGLNSIIASMVVITLIGLLAAILTTRSIIKPLNKLREGTEMIAKGNLDYKVGTNARDEIGQLSRAFDQMTEGLTTTMTSVDNLNAEIEERKKAEEDLRASQEFSTSLLENAPHQLLVINPDTSIRYVNPRFEEANGWTLDEVAGVKAPYPWWPDEMRTEEAMEGFKESIKMESGQIENFARKKNGEVYWLDINWASVEHEGEIQYCLINSTDITDRKKMENELRVHRDNLEEMVRERTIELTDVNKRLQHELKEREKAEIALLSAKDEAEKANRAKSEFLARTSHEIRTPIHGVLGTINLVLDSKLEQDQRQYLNLAMTSAEALLAIINDILDLSKIEAGQLAPESEGFDLRTTLEDTFDSLAVDAYKKDVELTYHLVNGTSTELIGDSRYLRQVLINLVGNAVKFTEKGEIAVIVESITDNKKETELHFSVRDTGIGIPKNKYNMIFDPFQQADGSINRKYGGTGLGLTISRHLVQQMGGDIWVESDKKSGTTFHFTGKYTKQKNGKRSRNDSKKMADINNIPVLLIEDNATNRLMMKDMLEKWGCKVTDVESGPAAFDAIKKAKAASIHYSIIILDKTIRDMDGFTIAKLMLNNSTKPSDIIMMLPPHNVSDDFSRCQEIGISNYIIKPIKESELLKGLFQTLGLAQESEDRKSTGIDHKEQLLPSLRILVAEDNPTSQLIARKTLEKMGHNVTIANNGSEAIKMYKKDEYDLVLMDAEMPVLNGLEATRRIREAEAESGQHIPIVAMTAYAMEEDKNRCLSAGMDTYLSKPAKPEEITAVIEGLFISEKQPGEVSESGDAVKSEEVPAVDIEAARRVFGDDDDLFSEAVDLFLAEDYPEQLRLLKDGIDSQDASAVRAAAHSIKGASRSLGGMVLGDICQRLEELGREEKLGDARALLRLIEIETERFADYYSSSESNQVEQPAKQ